MRLLVGGAGASRVRGRCWWARWDLIVEDERAAGVVSTLDAAQVISNPSVRQAFLKGFQSGQHGNQLAHSPSFWVGTQGDYDEISPKNPSTIYMIVEES